MRFMSSYDLLSVKSSLIDSHTGFDQEGELLQRLRLSEKKAQEGGAIERPYLPNDYISG